MKDTPMLRKRTDRRRLTPHTYARAPKQNPVTLRLVNVQGGDADRPDRYVEITIEDEASQKKIVVLEMTYEAFGEFVSGRSETPALVALSNVDYFGKFRETKPLALEQPLNAPAFFDSTGKATQAFLDAVAPYEVDGWKTGRLYNRQTTKVKSGATVFNIFFERYTDTDPETVPLPD